MIIFLHGKNTYSLHKKAKEIEEQYRKVHQTGLNLEKLKASEISFQDFWDKLQQISMFIKKKLFFLEEVFSQPGFKEDFLKKIKEISQKEDIVVIIEKGAVKKTDRLSKALKRYGQCQEFVPLEGSALKRWIERQFKEYGVSIDRYALERLIEFVGDDLWRMENEIKKLAAFRNGAISSRDVELMVKPNIETAIFKTTDALGARDKRRALNLIEEHLAKGESPFYLLSMFSFQFRNLLLVKSCQTDNKLRQLGMHPFVIRKTKGLAANFSLPELKKIFQKIFEADLDIKTGRINPEEGIRFLVAEI